MVVNIDNTSGQESSLNAFNPINYIFTATTEQKSYIQKVIDGTTSEPMYYSNGSRYWLMVPVKTSGKTLILYISDYQFYGKLGSY